MRIEDHIKRLKEGILGEKHAMIERHRLRKSAKESIENLIILAGNWSLIKPKKYTKDDIHKEEIERLITVCLNNIVGEYVNDWISGKEGMILKITEEILQNVLDSENKHLSQYISELDEWIRLEDVMEGIRKRNIARTE